MVIEIPSWSLSIICFAICLGCLPDSRQNIHIVYTDPCSLTFMGVIKWLKSLMIILFLFSHSVHCNNTITELICAPHRAIFALDEELLPFANNSLKISITPFLENNRLLRGITANTSSDLIIIYVLKTGFVTYLSSVSPSPRKYFLDYVAFKRTQTRAIF